MSADARRLAFVVATMAAQLTVSVISSIYHLGWVSLTVTVGVLLVLYLAYILWYADDTLFRWLLFGLAAGWVELAPDWWLVARTRSLYYPAREWMAGDSPLYMPFDWAVVLLQLGVIGDWLRQRLGITGGTLALGLLGGSFIPVYEHLAKNALWWSYSGTPMLLDAPYYVILAEFLLTLPLPAFGWLAERTHPAMSLVLGIAEGGVMMAAVLVTWMLMGPTAGAVITLPNIP
jgi:hypothetical protein